VGGADGIERLRDTVFMTYYASGGVPSRNNGPLYVDSEGRTWSVRAMEVYIGAKRATWGGSPQLRYRKTLSTRLTGRKGELWIGRRGGLTHLRESGASFIAKTYTAADWACAKQGVCGSSEQVMERYGLGP